MFMDYICYTVISTSSLQYIKTHIKLTLNQLNFLNGIMHQQYVEMANKIINYNDIKLRTISPSNNSKEPSQNVHLFMLVCLYTCGNG